MTHITRMDEFRPGLCLAAATEWPDNKWPHWHLYSYADSQKYASKDASRLTPACKVLINLLAGQSIAPADTFPDLSLHGAGMHMIETGGYLKRHTDGERHPTTGWFRRFNAIVFLSDCDGGELVIDGHDPVRPRFGQVVGFESSVPHEVLPVTGGVRKTLSLFWWSLDGIGETTAATFER